MGKEQPSTLAFLECGSPVHRLPLFPSASSAVLGRFRNGAEPWKAAEHPGRDPHLCTPCGHRSRWRAWERRLSSRWPNQRAERHSLGVAPRRRATGKSPLPRKPQPHLIS